jgi:hypothetical protein
LIERDNPSKEGCKYFLTLLMKTGHNEGSFENKEPVVVAVGA